ncbi:copper amine oxidase [Aspergillus bertholletiae]|uniref:Amine oxidase n=1 Tax=Aspergillus bertholletiae TaxID=1226010 RepID=A0A5N7BEH6_9EURO|nr:copper amine oxidase [Aspergillus bertholletiae]
MVIDPLTAQEIIVTAALIHDYVTLDNLKFNCIALHEPRRCEYTAFCDGTASPPDRRAFSSVLRDGTGQVSEAVVNLRSMQVESWKDLQNVLPVCENSRMEDVARTNPQVIKLCREIGIEDMSKVYFDIWATSIKDRSGLNRPLQRVLPYYRLSTCDNQYAYPLDFHIMAHCDTNEIVSVGVRHPGDKQMPISLEEYNPSPQYLEGSYCRHRSKHSGITEPSDTSFQADGNEITWVALKMHVGFNDREGVVLSDIRIDDPCEQREKMLFNRISVADITMPHRSPGSMAHSPRTKYDCVGAIHSLDAVTVTTKGEPLLIKNAICIHEEDNGPLYKHTNTRDHSVVSTRHRKLVISDIVTIANLDYAFYHIFTLDGMYKLEAKLAGTPTTSWPHQPGGLDGLGTTEPHNHPHIFCPRVDPAIDGPHKNIVQNNIIFLDGSAPGSKLVNTKKAPPLASSHCATSLKANKQISLKKPSGSLPTKTGRSI